MLTNDTLINSLTKDTLTNTLTETYWCQKVHAYNEMHFFEML
jgi:hypothetical protein